MWRYVLGRLATMLLVFLGTTFLAYAAVFALPGDPVRALFGDRPVSPSTLQAVREQYHLDEPLLVQYGWYLRNAVTGDLGTDFRGRPVADIVAEALPVTAALTFAALVFVVGVGMVAGAVAAVRRGSPADHLVRAAMALLVAVPVFVIGYALQFLLAIELPLFPVAGTAAGWRSYVLPGLVLASAELAYVSGLMRTGLLETMRADHVRTARAKGLPPGRLLRRHILPLAATPVITHVGASVGSLMVGAVVVERVFNLPGLGRVVFLAVQQQDNAVVVAIVTLVAAVAMTSALLVDIAYAALDPRVRYA